MQKFGHFIIIAWFFFYYDPLLNRDLVEVGSYTQEECEQQRFDKYNLLIKKFNGKHDDSWWISPACHEKE
jgi:hypothetical protein